MLKNYLKISIRNLSRNFTYSFINISGLAIGLASCLLIVVYVQHELGYDSFHSDSDRIYRVGYEVSLGSGSKVIASSPYRLAGALQNDFPQLEKVTHFSRLYTTQVSYKEKVFRESRIAFADSNFFQVFDFAVISGNENSVLNHPYQAVITNTIAKKYFDNEDPLGKTLEIGSPYSDDSMEVTVAAVMEEMPSNTHFHMNILVSMSTGQTVFSDNLRNSWGWDSQYTYVVLPDSYKPEQFSAELIKFGEKYIGGDWFIQFFAQKVEDIHLYSNLNSEIESNGSITYIYIFLAVAFIILIIAAINYMNLATARAADRAQEVGVRKAVGANQGQLVKQFLGESVLMVAMAMILAIVLTELFLPIFNDLSGKSIDINLLANNQLLFGFISLSLVIGLLSGIYPAFFLSSFQPVTVLKENKASVNKGALTLRKGLVTMQFTISIILIAGTIIVYSQLDFLRTKDIGADTDHVAIIPVQTSAISNNYETIRTQLINYSSIEKVATSNRRIGRDINSGTFYNVVNEKGDEVTSRLSNVWVGWEFFNLYQINIQYGRAFSTTYPADTVNNAVIINREAARVLELNPEKAVGNEIWAGDFFRGEIVGVADDFHFEALYNQIKPMIFILNPEFISYIHIKMNGRGISETMSYVREVWKQFEPDRIFISSFLDQSLYKIYIAEEKFMQVFTVFTLLAIFTACLGVFGLAKFSASRRTKEIGVRKVLGASALDIIYLFSSEILRITVMAFLIAVPIAYLVMKEWLQQFAYKTTLSFWIFIASGVIAGLIAWLTVCWQALRASGINPVECLRSE